MAASLKPAELPEEERPVAPQDGGVPGQLPELFGRYQILSRLGQGGMGSVHLAEDTVLGRRVALKVPDFGPGDGPEARKRFFQEARAAATLEHPYLCPVYDVGEVDGRLYLTMAYVEGKTLADSVRAEGLPPRQVAALVGKLAVALHEAHVKGVVHRDLKPSNIMIRKAGARREPVIVDFGLAHRADPNGSRLTRSGFVMGTLSYMAPEQIRGDPDAIGPPCDIYALGVILYELLTGRLPFTGAQLAVVGQILTQDPIAPTTHRPGLDPRIEAVCLKAMARNTLDRYSTMIELAGALTDYLRQASDSPRSAPPSGPAPESESHRTTGSDSLVARLLRDGTSQVQESPDQAFASLVRIEPESPTDSATRADPVTAGGDSPGSRHPSPKVVAGAVFGVFLLCGIIYVATDYGQIKLVLDDRDAVVKVDGNEVKVNNLGEPITLRAGAHELAVKWGEGEFLTRRFVVRRGGNEALRVEFEPNGSSLKVVGSAVLPPGGTGPVAEKRSSRTEPGNRKRTDLSPRSASDPVQADPGVIRNSIGMELKKIPAGEFVMGTGDNPAKEAIPKQSVRNASPRHKVRITRPFYLGMYEVTQEEYWSVIAANPSARRGEANLPVESVSWFDALNFCNRLSDREGLVPYYRVSGDEVSVRGGDGYRLPTEAEWEYACRGGTQTLYPFGDTGQALGDHAWTGDNSGDLSQSVGRKRPNGYGLYDMLGNVGEWCYDWHADYTDNGGVTDDPTGPNTGVNRVLRGGGFQWHTPGVFTPFHRATGVVPHDWNRYHGFRVARDVPPEGRGAISPSATDRLVAGTVWAGKKTDTAGVYAGVTVACELHVRERNGETFQGYAFYNGTGRNRAEVEGEIRRNAVTWRERSGGNDGTLVHIKGTVDGTEIRFQSGGRNGRGQTFEGEGRMSLQ